MVSERSIEIILTGAKKISQTYSLEKKCWLPKCCSPPPLMIGLGVQNDFGAVDSGKGSELRDKSAGGNLLSS